MIWTRLNIVVEGYTEEEIANEVLGPHLSRFSVQVSARMVSHRRDRSRKHKGGLGLFEHLRRDVDRWTREDRADNARFTTMADLYAYPRDAPGYDESSWFSARDRVRVLENALSERIADRRFIPYIQLHEFETLLFADLGKWPQHFLGQDAAIKALADSVAGFADIELIDDGEHTAPSKRILQHLPAYDKVADGRDLALRIGLPAIRAKCTHFDEWIASLEKLGHGH